MLAALEKVGLDATVLSRTPGQISGGQRQRVSIARALAAEPRLLICDEPVSALDASNRNHVLRLLDELRDSLGLSIVIISHDLSSLAGIADRVDRAVPRPDRRGRPGRPGVRRAAAPVYRAAHGVRAERPARPAVLARTSCAAPGADPEPPPGPDACVFAARCPFAVDACATQPALETVGERWSAACHRRDDWPGLARDRAPAPGRPDSDHPEAVPPPAS